MSRTKLGRVSDPDPNDPPPHVLRNGIGAGSWFGAPFSLLPPGCPVEPLGRRGGVCLLTDSLGQEREVRDAEWSKRTMIGLFARVPNYPYWAWPRWGIGEDIDSLKIVGIDMDAAITCLMAACARRGVLPPAISLEVAPRRPAIEGFPLAANEEYPDG